MSSLLLTHPFDRKIRYYSNAWDYSSEQRNLWEITRKWFDFYTGAHKTELDLIFIAFAWVIVCTSFKYGAIALNTRCPNTWWKISSSNWLNTFFDINISDCMSCLSICIQRYCRLRRKLKCKDTRKIERRQPKLVFKCSSFKLNLVNLSLFSDVWCEIIILMYPFCRFSNAKYVLFTSDTQKIRRNKPSNYR